MGRIVKDLYEKSVGRNASLLLNVPPAKDGRIAAEDVASLTAFGTAVRETYGKDLRAAGPGPWTFDRIGLAEDIRHGQRVERFAVQARIDGAWTTVAQGTTLGHRPILALHRPVTSPMPLKGMGEVPPSPYGSRSKKPTGGPASRR
ncbi:hypothetical protein ACH4SK_33060 [Streptomyces inhibens]|uniref:hypothetical protein n=1 Tax=Streptomyces inhibens TaxID=2293571 RepID=UPI0037B41712